MTALADQLGDANGAFHRPAVPAVYGEYVAFMATGQYPYITSIVAVIARKYQLAAELWAPTQRFDHEAVHEFARRTGCDLLVKLTHEVYLASEEYRLAQLAEKVVGALAEGFERIDSLDKVTKFRHVVHFGFYSGGTGWQEWDDARLVPEESASQAAISGPVHAVLPKGCRTKGHLIHGKVLAKR